jgi:hypothetical protein
MQIFFSKYERTTGIFTVNGVQMCLILPIGVTMNILTYYGLKEGKNATRIACLVFHIMFWIVIAPTLLYNLKCYINIFKSEATKYAKITNMLFLAYVYIVMVMRIGLYLVYYPSVVMISKDYEGFPEKFAWA